MRNKSRHNITEEETAVYEALKSAAISDRILELQKKGTPAQKDQTMERVTSDNGNPGKNFPVVSC